MSLVYALKCQLAKVKIMVLSYHPTLGLMLARPSLCGGGVGPGLREDFPTSVPCPTVAGFQSAPLHRSPAVSATETVDGGRRAGFEGMA